MIQFVIRPGIGKRAIPKALVERTRNFHYDKEKYRDMLLATETILGYSGFNGTVFGYAPKKNKKRWQHINEKKLRDRDTETT